MPSSEAVTKRLLAVLPLLNRIVSQAVRQEAGDDITMPQFRALALLAEQPITLSALARARRVSLQSMGELVQALVERGWIERSPDPNDRRQSQLLVTKLGLQRYEAAERASFSRLAPLVAQLTPEELAAVELALPALRRVLSQEEGE